MTNILRFLLFEDSRIGQFIEIEVENKLIGDEGRKIWELWFNTYSLSVWEDKKFWKCIVLMVLQYCECSWCHWIVYIKMVKTVNFMLCLCSHNKIKHRVSAHSDF